MTLKTSLLSAALLLPALAFAAFPVPESLDLALRSVSPGDVVTMGFSSISGVRALNAYPNRFESSGGVLIYSDDPETAESTGILYQDVLPAGRQRVYLYHVNGRTQQSRFSIVAENTGTEEATVTPMAWSFPRPSGHYVQVGREGVRQFYENTVLPPVVAIAPGERALLASDLDSTILSQNQLAAAILDYSSTQPLRVSTVMVSSQADTLEVFPTLGFAPNDGNNRQGTFAAFDRKEPGGVPYAYDFQEGIVRLRIGDGGVYLTDPPAAGIDAERSAPTNLMGNYGITYNIRVAAKNSTGQHLAVLVNPRGGDYGGYFRVSLNGGTAKGQLVPAATSVVPPTISAGVVALLDTPGGTSTVGIELIPAGASSLAIDILLVPYGDHVPVPTMWTIRGQ